MSTPRTDALLSKRRAIEPRNEIWDVDDVQEFLRHSRQLETELAAEREKVAKLREKLTHAIRELGISDDASVQEYMDQTHFAKSMLREAIEQTK